VRAKKISDFRATIFCYDMQGELTSTKLKVNLLRGSLSSIAVLPLNRLLLLGTDSGVVQLIA